jgi:hypothetical protein
MTPIPETLPEIAPEQINGAFSAATLEEQLIGDEAAIPEDVQDALKLEKKKRKALKKAGKKKLKSAEKKVSVKSQAVTFPMVELIDEQVRTSIPPELVARVKAVKSKKTIISSNYPYAKQMKEEDYLEEIELLQIELVKMQAWVKEVGERIVLIFEGRDAAGKGGTIQRFTENLNPRACQALGHGARPVVFPALHRKAPH